MKEDSADHLWHRPLPLNNFSHFSPSQSPLPETGWGDIFLNPERAELAVSEVNCLMHSDEFCELASLRRDGTGFHGWGSDLLDLLNEPEHENEAASTLARLARIRNMEEPILSYTSLRYEGRRLSYR
jgi:hypothetical protein